MVDLLLMFVSVVESVIQRVDKFKLGLLTADNCSDGNVCS